MQFLEMINNNLGTIAGIVIALGAIIAGVYKCTQFVTKVNKKLEFIDMLEKKEILGKIEIIEKTITTHDQILNQQTIINANIEKLCDSLAAQMETIENSIQVLKTTLDQLVTDFNSHCEDGKRTNTLLLSQARFTLETAMKSSINKGCADLNEKQLIGDLYHAYSINDGDYGINDLFAIYKELPTSLSNENK